MSVTVYVNGWNNQPSIVVREFLLEKYPQLLLDDFPDHLYSRDEHGRPYEDVIVYKDPYPSLEFRTSDWLLFAGQLQLSCQSGGSCSLIDLPALIRRSLVLLNDENRIINTVRQPFISGNHIGFGTTPFFVSNKLKQLIELSKFAFQKKEFIHWG